MERALVTEARAEDITRTGGRQDNRRILWIAFLLALVVRGAAAWFSGAAQPQEIRYLTIAEGILSGRGFTGLDNRFPTIIQPPLFPLTLAAALLLPGPALLLGRGLSLLLGALLVFPAGAIARRLFGESAAGRAALLAAVYPILSHVSSAALTESLFSLLICGACILVARGLERQPRTEARGWLPPGLLLGLSFITRPEGLAYLAALTAALPLLARLAGRRWGEALRILLYPIAGFALVVAPYVVWVHQQTGQWMLAPKAALVEVHHMRMQEGQREQWKEPFGSTLFYERVKFGLNADATAIRSHEQFLRSRASVGGGILASEEGEIRLSNPGMALRTVGRNLTELYFETIKYGFVIPTILLMFAGIGLFSRPWAGPTRIWTLLTATFFVGSLSFLVTHVESRFLYSAVPFVLPFMAEGWRRAEVWALASLSGGGAARAAIARRLVPPAFGAVVLSLTLIHLIPPVQITGRLWSEHRELGIWLLETAGPGRTVMAATPAVAYYSRARFEVLPYGDLEAVVRYARHKGVDYLVADRAEVPTFRPQLTSLLVPERPHPGLELVEARHRGTSRAIFLYRVSDSSESVRN